MIISSHVIVNEKIQARNAIPVPVLLGQETTLTPELLYEYLKCSYLKFFKMDKLCKWAVAGTEWLFDGKDELYSTLNKSKIAVVMATAHGCIDVDKRYQEGIAVPSPALFVYTLPNIMLGELCIRYGFKGEQLCTVSERFDADELYFNVHDMLMNKGMDACLCGWVDTTGDQYDISLYWVTKKGIGTAFTPGKL